MECKINWPAAKVGNFENWKYILYGETEKFLKSSNMVELSSYNQVGYYHNFKNLEYYSQARDTWLKESGAVSKRIHSGYSPGIWTSMFHPCNTHNLVEKPYVVRFTFKEGFSIYDRHNPVHQKMADFWKPQGRENQWENEKDKWGWNFARKMEFCQNPSHKSFYENNNIGAIIGYSDFLSPVIILENAIKNVEFLV